MTICFGYVWFIQTKLIKIDEKLIEKLIFYNNYHSL